jgi:hypothetical protein
MDDALEVFDVLMTEDLLARAQKESTSRYLRGLTPLFWIPLLPYGAGGLKLNRSSRLALSGGAVSW